MHELKFSLSKRISPYTDRGCFDQNTVGRLRPAARAAQVRDGHVCQYCGFHSRKYQQCVGADTEIADDLRTVCIFCELVIRVDLVPRMRSGVLIWLPEMTQAALNRAMPEVYVRRIARPPASDRARDVLTRLMSRRELVKSKFGSDDPARLVERLEDRPGEKSVHQLAQDGLRLLPLDRRIVLDGKLEFNQFPQILAYWRSAQGPFAATNSQSFQAFELGLTAV